MTTQHHSFIISLPLMNIHPAAVAVAAAAQSPVFDGFRVAPGSNAEMIPELRRLVDSRNIILYAGFSSLTANNAQQVIDDLYDLARDANDPLFAGTHHDGRRHSGVAWADHTKPILQKSSVIRQLIKEIEVEWWIMHGWVFGYGEISDTEPGGEFDWHNDKKYRGKYRMIINFGSRNKIFWIRRHGDESMKVGIFVPHGTAVILNSIGGGYTGQYQHKVTECLGSHSLVLEIVLKREFATKPMDDNSELDLNHMFDL